ncbi:unnamed protein product [Prorocentrum cordatum]|uniref:Uncharacterized protein n=1 Tax=Prorocentrum cordatum TaxID=2364126 RepID=A0ABN9STF6_9DINO|nr:unnamed protein product [Polarella glacialis]
MTSPLRDALWSAVRHGCWGPAAKIQAAWRGSCVRAAVGVPLREAMALNRLLREAAAAADGPLALGAERAEVLEAALQALEELLRRAAVLHLAIPKFEDFVAVRARLAQRARAARLLADRLPSASAHEVSALAARAAACGLRGALLEAAERRAEALRSQLRVRCLLRAAAGGGEAAAAEEAVALAEAEGLSAAGAWLVEEGPASLEAARARAQELREAQRSEAEAEERLERQLAAAAGSVDPLELQRAIGRAEARGRPAQQVGPLRGRRDELRRQLAVLSELRSCARRGAAEPSRALARAEEAGLGAPEAWLLPEGPRVLARARCWAALHQREARAAEAARAQVEKQAAVLMCSFDLEAVLACAERARGAGAREDVPAALEARHGALRGQAALCEQLRLPETPEAADAALGAVAEAGLGPAPAGWLQPDGPRLLARAALWRAAWAASAEPLGETPRAAAAALRGCLGAEDAGRVAGALAEARRVGLELRGGKELPRAWPPGAPGRGLVAAAAARLEALEEREAALRHRLPDLDWQARRLRSLLSGAGARLLLGEAELEALARRCGELRRQLPPCRALLCALLHDPRGLDRAVADARAAGLDQLEACAVPEGPALVAAAERRLRRLAGAPGGGGGGG